MLLNAIEDPPLLEEHQLENAKVDQLLALIRERNIFDIGETASKKTKAGYIEVLKKWNVEELARRGESAKISIVLSDDSGNAATINAHLPQQSSSKQRKTRRRRGSGSWRNIIDDDDDDDERSPQSQTTKAKRNIFCADESESLDETPCESTLPFAMDLQTSLPDPGAHTSLDRPVAKKRPLHEKREKRGSKYLDDEAEGSGDDNDHIGEGDDSNPNEYELGPSVTAKGSPMQFLDDSGKQVVGFVTDEAQILFEDAHGNAVTTKAAAYGDVLETLKQIEQGTCNSECDVRSLKDALNSFCVTVEEYYNDGSEDVSLALAMTATAKQLVKRKNIS